MCNRFGGRISGGVNWWVIGSSGVSRKTRLVSPQFTDVRHSLPIVERGAGQKLKHQCRPVTGGADKKQPQRGRIYFFFNILNNVVKRKKKWLLTTVVGTWRMHFHPCTLGFAGQQELLYWGLLMSENYCSGCQIVLGLASPKAFKMTCCHWKIVCLVRLIELTWFYVII